jgi:RHS repeat-associated protein
VGTYAACGNSGTINCSFGQVKGDGVIKARVKTLNEQNVTIEMLKCSGTFTQSGKMYIKTAICNSSGNLAEASYSKGGNSASVTFTHNVTPGSSRIFYVTITSTDNNFRYYAEPLTISAICPIPTGMNKSNVKHNSFRATWNSIPGATYKVNYVKSSGSYPGTTLTTSTNYVDITGLAGCTEYKFRIQAILSSCESDWTDDTYVTTATYPAPTNISVSNRTSTTVRLNWTAVEGGFPAYQVQSCDGSIIWQNHTIAPFDNVTGLTPNTTYSMRVLAKNQNSSTCFSAPSSCVTFTTLNTVPPAPTNLTATKSGTSNINLSWEQQSLTADFYKVYRANSSSPENYSLIYTSSNRAIGYLDSNLPNGTYYYQVEACNTVGCSSRSNTSQSITISSAPPAPKLVCGDATITPANPVQNQNATFTFLISNTGNAAYTGTLNLMWRKNNEWHNLKSYTGGITEGGSYTFSISPTPLISAPGTWDLNIEDANNKVVCTKTVTVVAPSSCVGCTWTNPPASDVVACTAQAYLCQNGIIIKNQNGSENSTLSIQRNQLARVIYLALYGTSNPTTPADNFPVPFNDMQTLSPQNTYWYYAAKALSYLEYGDGVSPFGRDFYNFRPGDPIQRRNAMKVFLEAFDVPKSTVSSPYFSDVPASDPMFGYIQKAKELGLVEGYKAPAGGCPTGTCFNPSGFMTREQAFIILYRLMTFTNFTRPTSTHLQSETNYYIPSNVQLANMGNLPGLDQGNFNHYEKTSFSIPGRGLPLDFTHTYNSFLTELPDAFFKDGVATSQNFQPLGYGWSHTFNNFIQFEPGYTYVDDNGTTITINPKYYIFWSDGTIHVFDQTLDKYETLGIYDSFTRSGSTITIKTKSQMAYTFTKTGSNSFYLPAAIADRNSNRLVYNYQNGTGSSLRIANVTDERTNRRLDFTYQTVNGKDYITSVKETGLNRTVYFNINSNGDLASYTDPKGQASSYYYDGTRPDQVHLLNRIKLPKGNIITNTYEQRKLKSIQTNTNKINVNWKDEYSTAQGQASSEVVDNLNRKTSYNYNTLGKPTKIQTPTSTINNIQYGTGQQVFAPQNMDIQGQSVTMQYDSRGNLKYISKNGITNTFSYTTLNDIETQTDGKGYTTTYNYDTKGNLTKITRPGSGGNILINRNSYGQTDKITNPSGIVTTIGFDGNGNVNNIQMPLGITSSATFDNASRLKTKTDPNGLTTSIEYDNNDNVVSETNALNFITKYVYDANDNLKSIENAKGEATTMNYRFDDDLIESESFGGQTKSYTYYNDGNLKTFTKPTGTFNYSYDNQGRLSSDGQTSYTYDTRGNIATITNTNGTLRLYYDLNDRLDYYDDYYGNRVKYTYDNNHNVATLVYPGNKTVTYTYDELSRMKTVTDWNGKQTIYTYLTDDRPDQVTYPNGTYAKYGYDLAGRLTGISNKKSNGSIISEYSFVLDNAGNHTSENINEPALAAGLANLASKTENYAAMPYNRIVNNGSTSFGHDATGNITQRGGDTYTFDLNDNLLSATGAYPASYSYDGAGNRRSSNANGTQVRYILSILGMSQVLIETNQSNTPICYYIYGAGGLISRVKPDGTTHFYHYDFRGSTTALTDAAQHITHSYSYDPFGNMLAANEPAGDANTYRYNGKYGVQHECPTRTFMRARYYDPTIGRFISEDPIWSTNLYPFADNNPIINIDPNGEISENAEYIIDGMLLTMDKVSEIIVKNTDKESGKVVEKILKIRSRVFGYTLNGALIWADTEKGLWDKVAETLGLVADDLITESITRFYVGTINVGLVKAYLVSKGIESAFMDNYYGLKYGYTSKEFNKYQSSVSKGWGLILDAGISYFNSITMSKKIVHSSKYGAGYVAPYPK